MNNRESVFGSRPRQFRMQPVAAHIVSPLEQSPHESAEVVGDIQCTSRYRTRIALVATGCVEAVTDFSLAKLDVNALISDSLISAGWRLW